MFFILLPILSLYLGTIVLADSTDESIIYALCEKNIESVEVVEQGKMYSVNIKLAASDAEEFYRLTLENIGKRLDVIIGNTLVTTAIIQAGIKSGSVLSTPKEKVVALELKQRIQNSAPIGPCGMTK
jgi:preprotein translocase subunit SecD